MQERQFIYIASREGESNLVKIGFSKNPIRRMQELSGTGAVFPFHLLHAWEFKKDAAIAEKLIHEKLDYARVNTSREFFDIFVAYSRLIDINLPDVINSLNICSRLSDDIDKILTSNNFEWRRIYYNELTDYYYSTHGRIVY